MTAFRPILPRKTIALPQSKAALGSVAFQIGTLVAVERNRKKLTQDELGARVGIDQAYVSTIENGQHLPGSVTNGQIEALFSEIGLAGATLQLNFVKWWRDNR